VISLIEAVFGSKIGRIIAEIVLALIATAALVLHFEHKGAAAELGRLKASSTELIEKVRAANDADTKQYQAAVAASQEKANAAIAARATLQSQLANSVRQFDAYRHSHPAVAGAGGPGSAAGSGECGSQDCGAVAEGLAVRGNELAGSLGAVSADLQSCQRERDALTGEPK
jgi:hypothetical protein